MRRFLDADAADAAMIALWRDSATGSFVRSVSRRVQRAWIDSWSRRLLAALGVVA